MPENPMSNLMFQLMSWEYKIKSIFSPPEEVLAELKLNEGSTVVDFGCGPGRYTIPLARMVGKTGEVYAVDILPLALKKVKKEAAKEALNNVKTLYAANIITINDNIIDAVILFDTLHDIKDKSRILQDIYRILKPGGSLFLKDHHLTEDEIVTLVSQQSRYVLSDRTTHILHFVKDNTP